MNSEMQFFAWVMAGGFVLLLILMYEILKRLNSIDRHLADIAGQNMVAQINPLHPLRGLQVPATPWQLARAFLCFTGLIASAALLP
jgi:hypothetical protein